MEDILRLHKIVEIIWPKNAAPSHSTPFVLRNGAKIMNEDRTIMRVKISPQFYKLKYKLTIKLLVYEQKE